MIHAESWGTYGSPSVIRALPEDVLRIGRNRVIRSSEPSNCEAGRAGGFA